MRFSFVLSSNGIAISKDNLEEKALSFLLLSDSFQCYTECNTIFLIHSVPIIYLNDLYLLNIGVELFSSGIGDLYYPSNELDPYIVDQDVS